MFVRVGVFVVCGSDAEKEKLSSNLLFLRLCFVLFCVLNPFARKAAVVEVPGEILEPLEIAAQVERFKDARDGITTSRGRRR